MKKLLAVIDYQKDFVDGALGFEGAEALSARIAEKIRLYRAEGGTVAFTFDTHGADYLDTHEGRLLPVPHCIEGTEGWRLYGEIAKLVQPSDRQFNKPAFGSLELMNYAVEEQFDSVELVGLVSNICVVANAELIRAALPEAEVTVDAACTASNDARLNAAALDVLRSTHVRVINDGADA